MRREARLSLFLRTGTLATSLLLPALPARARLSGAADFNLSRMAGDQSECAITSKPDDPKQLFVACNTTPRGRLFAARSTDGGVTWDDLHPGDKTIADGDPGQGPAACCDPSAAWDRSGNLFLTYVNAARNAVELIYSKDGGTTFSNLASFPGTVDQPTVAATRTSTPVSAAVWVVWNLGGQMMAAGVRVTGLGEIGQFGRKPQTIPGTMGCSFGDIAIAPSGAVFQACQRADPDGEPSKILVSTDSDGLGGGTFGNPIVATETNVGGYDVIPALNGRGVDAEVGLAFDDSGRLYLVYTEEKVDGYGDMDIMLRSFDDEKQSWGARIQVNNDPSTPIRSQFLPRLAIDSSSGSILVCWHDCRKSLENTAMELYCADALPAATPTFATNVAIGDGSWISDDGTFGEYAGLDYSGGVGHPVWAKTSKNRSDVDAVTDRVTEAGGN